MKTKAIIWIGLILQVCFLVFMLFNAPEPHSGIKLGIEKMQTTCPAQAPTGSKTAEGNWIIKTAGDEFVAAKGGYEYIMITTMSFTLASIAISGLLLFSHRKKDE